MSWGFSAHRWLCVEIVPGWASQNPPPIATGSQLKCFIIWIRASHDSSPPQAASKPPRASPSPAL